MSDDDLSFLARLREQGQIGDEEYAAYARELAQGGTLPTDLRSTQRQDGEPDAAGSAPAEPASSPAGLPELRIFRFPGGGPPGATAPEEPAATADDENSDEDADEDESGLDDYEPISSWAHDDSTVATTYTPDLGDVRGPGADPADLAPGPLTPPSHSDSGAGSDRGFGAPAFPQTPPPYPAVNPQSYAGQPATGQPGPGQAAAGQPGGAGLPPRGGPPAADPAAGGSRNRLPLVIGGVILLVVAAVAVWFVLPGGDPTQSAVDDSQAETGKDPAASESSVGPSTTAGQSDPGETEGWAATSCTAVSSWEAAAAPLPDRIADAAAQESSDATDQLVGAYQSLSELVKNLEQAVATPAPTVEGGEAAAERLVQAVADVKRQLEVGITEAQNSLPPGSPFGTKANELLLALEDLSDDPQDQLEDLVENAPAPLRKLFTDTPECDAYLGGR